MANIYSDMGRFLQESFSIDDTFKKSSDKKLNESLQESFDNQVTLPEVLGWLSEHETAYEDCKRHFGMDFDDPDFDEEITVHDLEEWISEHEGLWADYLNHFNITDPFLDESLKEAYETDVDLPYDPDTSYSVDIDTQSDSDAPYNANTDLPYDPDAPYNVNESLMSESSFKDPIRLKIQIKAGPKIESSSRSSYVTKYYANMFNELANQPIKPEILVDNQDGSGEICFPGRDDLIDILKSRFEKEYEYWIAEID